MPTSNIDSITFKSQFDINRDLVITVDYSISALSSVPASGGFTLGLFDNSATSSIYGNSTVDLLGYTVTNALLGICFDFDGLMTTSFTGVSTYNCVSLYGPVPDAFPFLTTSNRLTSINLANGSAKRIRSRITDFGNTIIVDYYDFVTNQFNNILTYTNQCTFSACGVFMTYAYYSDAGTQTMVVSNINLNGMFTDQYILSSTV